MDDVVLHSRDIGELAADGLDNGSSHMKVLLVVGGQRSIGVDSDSLDVRNVMPGDVSLQYSQP